MQQVEVCVLEDGLGQRDLFAECPDGFVGVQLFHHKAKSWLFCPFPLLGRTKSFRAQEWFHSKHVLPGFTF